MTRLRRAVQTAVVVFLLSIAVLNQYESAKVKYGGHTLIEDSKVFTLIDRAIGKAENRHNIAIFFRGGLWSMDIGRFQLTDPLAALSGVARARTFYAPLVLGSILPIAVTLIFGRFFCGWICPMNLLLEINHGIRRLFERIGFKFFDVRFSPMAKYGLLGIGLIFGLLWGVDMFSPLYPPRVISSEIYSSLAASATGFGMAFLVGILLLELFASERMWCRYFCPGSALYSLLSGKRALRVSQNAANCTKCHKCDSVCPLSIRPSRGNVSFECDNCALCVEACGFDALSFGFGGGDKITNAVSQVGVRARTEPCPYSAEGAKK